MNVAVRFQGTKRGVFGLTSWSPLPRPGEAHTQSFDHVRPIAKSNVSSSFARNVSSTNAPSLNGNVNGQASERSYAGTGTETRTAESKITDSRTKSDAAKRPPEAPSAGQRLIAKFSYNAKQDSPLGQDAEISLKTMDKMTMVGPHKHQDYWWLVRMDDGREGYVPANYVTRLQQMLPSDQSTLYTVGNFQLFEEKVTSLPWLAGKVLDPLPKVSLQDQSSYKPYKSAYDTSAEPAKPANSWYCEVCQKSFNGPQPYNAHMTSRAHKDEVEVQNAYKR